MLVFVRILMLFALSSLQSMYKSVSAFAPICSPTQCPWGQKAFSGYLGDNKESWKVSRGC